MKIISYFSHIFLCRFFFYNSYQMAVINTRTEQHNYCPTVIRDESSVGCLVSNIPQYCSWLNV